MPYKACTHCGNIKEFSEFRKDSRLKSGIGSVCKLCSIIKAKAWNQKNLDRYKTYNKNWRNANKEYDTARKVAWYRANPEKKKQADARTYVKNRDKKLAQYKRYRQANYEKIKERNKQWLKENIHIKLQHNAKRRAAKLNRTPTWLTPDDIWLMNEFYHLAKLRSTQTKTHWHVDHIIPLLGETVSGLHIPQNLQVIPATLNLKKSNKFA
jgi:hypothetical protein